MSAISLINSGVAWFVAAAVLAFLFSFQKTLSGWIAGIGGAVGSLYMALNVSAGLSPLARGTPEFEPDKLRVRRFIPAGAGNTRPHVRE